MKVSELIKELEKCNQDAYVIVDFLDMDSSYSEFEVFTDKANTDFVYLIDDKKVTFKFGVYRVYTWDYVTYTLIEKFETREAAQCECDKLRKEDYPFKGVTYTVMSDIEYYNLMH